MLLQCVNYFSICKIYRVCSSYVFLTYSMYSFIMVFKYLSCYLFWRNQIFLIARISVIMNSFFLNFFILIEICLVDLLDYHIASVV
jgi:hypothetical protein